jgi:two-component system phosphate regulon response regulator OmpR
MKPHILVVDDDQRLRDLIKRYLEQSGDYYISTCGHVHQARHALACFHFHALILDIMMPDILGTELLTVPDIPPVLLLSAKDQPKDRIHGLEQGARDYLTKPFEPRELVLRLNNILARARPTVHLGACTYCLTTRRLVQHQSDSTTVPIVLSPSETLLFDYLAKHPHTLVSRQALADSVGAAHGNARSIDMQITRLRKKIEPCPQTPHFLISIRGQGYMLCPDAMPDTP